MTLSLKNIGETLFKGYLILVFVWITFALTFDIFGIIVHFTNPDLEQKVSNEIAWKIDGIYKNVPGNIWYEEPKTK